MADILLTSFPNAFTLKKYFILIPISRKLVTDPVDNKSVLAHIVVYCRTDAKPLSEPMMAKFIDRLHVCLNMPSRPTKRYVIETYKLLVFQKTKMKLCIRYS